jgi:hypothetical protein
LRVDLDIHIVVSWIWMDEGFWRMNENCELFSRNTLGLAVNMNSMF